MGWISMPVRCPACSSRLREHAILTHGGAVRCEKCSRLLFAVTAAHVGMVFAAEVTAAEIRHMRDHRMTLPAVLDYLGANFPRIAA